MTYMLQFKLINKINYTTPKTWNNMGILANNNTIIPRLFYNYFKVILLLFFNLKVML